MTSLRPIEAYEAALALLAPRGRAWPEAGGPVWRQLLAGLAPELREADARLLRLIEERDARTLGETLEDWERVLDLPDPCAPGDADFGERRAAVVSKLRAIGGASISYFVQLAADRGYEIEIVEYHPFRAGMSQAGGTDTVGSGVMRLEWTVKFKNRRVTWFRAGEIGSRAGETKLASIDLADEMECVIDRLKPAHTRVHFDYSDAA